MAVPNSVTTDKLTLLNWNANGVLPKRLTLMEFLRRHQVHLACISETHLTAQDTFKMRGYKVYRRDSETRRTGGVAILVRQNVAHFETVGLELDVLEVVSVVLKTTSGNLRITSAYLRPRRTLQKEDLEVLSLGGPTLILGDLNSKHQIWGCRNTNQNGRKLHNYSEELNFQIFAPEDYTYCPFQQNYSPDILDILLAQGTSFSINQFCKTELDSDHLPVLITFENNILSATGTPHLLKGKIDWDTFRFELDKRLLVPLNYSTTADIEAAVMKMTREIEISIKCATIPPRNRPDRLRPANYTPPHILALIREKNSIRRQWQNIRHPALKCRLNQLIRRVKWELETHRISKYQEYLESLTPGDPSLWRETRRLLRVQTAVPPVKCNGDFLDDEGDKAEFFADYFQRTFSPQDNGDTDTEEEVRASLDQTVEDSEEQDPVPFASMSELRRIIRKLPAKKSPGDDLIPNCVLKNFSRKAMAYLLSVINACLRMDHFPDKWKNGIITVIHKPGKPKDDPTGYRPISLLPSLSKVLEEFIYRRLIEHCESSRVIPPFQFGFRARHSTTMQLQRVSEYITQGFERKLYTAGVFLDISAAFDSVWHEGLLFKLKNFGFPQHHRKLIGSFLSSRTFHVRIGSTLSSTRPISAEYLRKPS